MIYFDTSALMKLVAREAESRALSEWVADRGDVPVVTSALTHVELVRAARRSARPDARTRVQRVLDSIDTIPINDDVIALAQTIGDDSLRSLDAIHLATAHHIALVDVLVTYDIRLADAARKSGLRVTAPA